ncbi:MAG: TetR/AcrR family transcriptional regulator, partial [Aquihabitans sp.]
MRRGLIIDAAERLLAEHDPLLVTFEQVADEAGVSRALVHAYLGDRRGLIDSVQVGIVSRLDTWVGHGLQRARTKTQVLEALVGGTFAFVESERDGWAVLMTSGGLDHPALHGVRARWVSLLAGDESDRLLPA